MPTFCRPNDGTGRYQIGKSALGMLVLSATRYDSRLGGTVRDGHVAAPPPPPSAAAPAPTPQPTVVAPAPPVEEVGGGVPFWIWLIIGLGIIAEAFGVVAGGFLTMRSTDGPLIADLPASPHRSRLPILGAVRVLGRTPLQSTLSRPRLRPQLRGPTENRPELRFARTWPEYVHERHTHQPSRNLVYGVLSS